MTSAPLMVLFRGGTPPGGVVYLAAEQGAQPGELRAEERG